MYRLGLDFGSTLTKMALTKPGDKDYPSPQAIFQYKTNDYVPDFYNALNGSADLFLKEFTYQHIFTTSQSA